MYALTLAAVRCFTALATSFLILSSSAAVVPKASDNSEAVSLPEALGQLDLAYDDSLNEDYLDAVLLYRSALPVIEKQLGTHSAVYTALVSELSSCYVQLGKWEYAEQFADKMLQSIEKCQGCTDEDRIIMYSNAAVIKMHFRKYAEAERCYDEALKLASEQSHVAKWLKAMIRVNSADIDTDLGHYVRALAKYRQALSECRVEADASALVHDIQLKIKEVQLKQSAPMKMMMNQMSSTSGQLKP